MDTVLKTGDLLLKLFRALTLKRVLLMSVLNMLGLLSVLVWYGREKAAEAMWPAKLSADLRPLALTDVRRLAADEMLKTRGDLISSVGIVSINAPANTRKVIYFKSNELTVQQQYDAVVDAQVSAEVPLWSARSDDNLVLIRLMGGEILCRPYGETIAVRYLQHAALRYSCAVGIPPGYSRRFRGIVFLLLRAAPNEVDEQRIKLLLLELAAKLDVEIR
jgi:hypothetical protein